MSVDVNAMQVFVELISKPEAQTRINYKDTNLTNSASLNITLNFYGKKKNMYALSEKVFSPCKVFVLV